MRIKPWAKLPVRWIHDGTMAELFKWRGADAVTGSSAIAALMIWITLVTQAEETETDVELLSSVDITYESLMRLTGLSKKLVAAGIDGLKNSNLIIVEKVGRFNRYILHGYESGSWTKLPARALYDKDRIVPFHHFNKRAACELHALKMYLYYAAVRDRGNTFTMASFEKIHLKTGVPEKRIPAANGFLISSGLMVRVESEQMETGKFKEPNKYFLRGYTDLFLGLSTAS